MTRRIVYGVSLWVFLGAAACTIASIALPDWVSYSSPVEGHDPIKISYGLHKRCSSVTGQCTKFPQYDDCHGDDRSFCSIWRTVGFAMNFSVVLLLACLVAYVTILVGGRGTREVGWKILCPLLSVVALAQLVAMSLVAGLYEHDARFFVGWTLAKSFILCTVSWIVLFVNATSVLGAAFCLEPEDDYERNNTYIRSFTQSNNCTKLTLNNHSHKPKFKMFGRRHHQTTTTAPSRRHRTHRTHHTTTTTTAPRRGLFSRRQPVVHQKRHATMGDKISGAFLKLKGSLTRRPGQKAAGTRRMRGTDGRGSRRSYRY